MNFPNFVPIDEQYRLARQALNPAQRLVNEIAEVCGASHGAVLTWLYGTHRPPRRVIDALSDYYGIDPDLIFSPDHFAKASERKRP